MTQQSDIYVCGNNNDGQLGMGDTDSKSAFTLLRSLSDKNVYRIFCGGNHTWVLLDEFIPTRKNYRPPSPLEGDKFKLS
jgi:alpha-tubulin suppressor-like RCC1 family protein